MNTYVCTKCGEVKPERDFYAYGGYRQPRCKECLRKQLRETYHSTDSGERRRARQSGQAYKIRKRELRAKSRASKSPSYLGDIMRIRLCGAVPGRVVQPVSAVRDLGMPLPEFKDYISSKFTGAMSWDNHGELWELDHIIPFHLVDVSNPDIMKKVVHFTNIRPLEKARNAQRNQHGVLEPELRELGLMDDDGNISFPIDQEKT